MKEEDMIILNKTKDLLEDIKTKYYTLCGKYSRLKGDVLDGGYYNEINAEEMSEEDYINYKEISKDISWLDRNLGTRIRHKDLYFIDKS